MVQFYLHFPSADMADGCLISRKCRAGSLLMLCYVCKQQSAVYFLLQQAKRALLFNVSNFQLSKLSSMRHMIWSRFESAHRPNIFFFSLFTIFSTFIFLPDHLKVIKSVTFLQKVKKNVSYC
jgi:hypothetical protein